MSSAHRSSESRGFRLQEFYHQELRREFVEDRLQHDGDFLIRNSADNKSQVVSVLWKDELRHFTPIVRTQNRRTLFRYADTPPHCLLL